MRGLQAKPFLNGTRGVVKEWLPEKSRYIVFSDVEQCAVLLKPESIVMLREQAHAWEHALEVAWQDHSDTEVKQEADNSEAGSEPVAMCGPNTTEAANAVLLRMAEVAAQHPNIS